MPPEFYQKDCKIKVIEYGVEESPADLIAELKAFISSYVGKITSFH